MSIWAIVCLIGGVYALIAAAFNPRLLWRPFAAKVWEPWIGETGLRVWCLVVGLMLLGVGVIGLLG